MSDLLGYARVSTGDQRLDLQLDALNAVGCQRVWSDTASGSLTDRPELAQLFDHLRAGDTLVVWRFDRLGRSVRHLIDLVGELGERDVGLRSLQEGIDTTTPTGRLVFHVDSIRDGGQRQPESLPRYPLPRTLSSHPQCADMPAYTIMRTRFTSGSARRSATTLPAA